MSSIMKGLVREDPKFTSPENHLYSARQASIFKDLGDGYYLGDDSYDDDDGFVKEGYTVYYKEGEDQFRQVSYVSMSPYSNPPGHIESEIERIIQKDKGGLEENKRIIGHDAKDPQIAVKGGAGSYNLSVLKKKALGEIKELVADVQAGKFKAAAYNVNQLKNTLETIAEAEDEMEKSYFGEDKDPCWKNYKQVGMKKKNGKEVPNCVPKKTVKENVTTRASKIMQKVESVVANYFPDGDPIDGLAPWMERNNVTMDEIDRVMQQNGYQGFWDYWQTLIDEVGGEAMYEVADTRTTANQTGGFITPEHDKAYATLKAKAPELYNFIRNEAPVPLDPVMTMQALRHMGSERAVIDMIKRELAKDTERMYDKNHPALAENIKRLWKKVLSEEKSYPLKESLDQHYKIADLIKRIEEYDMTAGPDRKSTTRLYNVLKWWFKDGQEIVSRKELARAPNLGRKSLEIVDTLYKADSFNPETVTYRKNKIIDLTNDLRDTIVKMDYDTASQILASLNDLVKDLKSKNLGETKKKGADGKACWKGYRYAGTENGKDKCVPVRKKTKESSVIKGTKR